MSHMVLYEVIAKLKMKNGVKVSMKRVKMYF